MFKIVIKLVLLKIKNYENIFKNRTKSGSNGGETLH